MESMQYNAVPAIADPIRSTSRENLYQELRLKSLFKRQWYWKLRTFSKYLKVNLWIIFYFLALAKHIKPELIVTFPTSVLNLFFRIFFPWTVIEWNDLDLNIRNSETFSAFKKSILKFIRPFSNWIFNCDSLNGIKLITRIRFGLSHLREHKFRQNFPDTLNSICHRDYYLLPINCPNY